MNKQNHPFNMITESNEIEYINFLEFYENINYVLRHNKKLDIDKNSGILKLAKAFNIKGFNIFDDSVEYNFIWLCKALFIYELYKLDISHKRINQIYLNLENNYKLSNYKYFFDLYCLKAKENIEVNFYIIWDYSLLLTPEELEYHNFIALRSSQLNIHSTTIKVNLNKILSELYEDHNLMWTKNNFHMLSEKESKIFSEMIWTPWKLDINIEFEKDWKEPKEILIKSKFKANTLSELNRKAREFQFWNFSDLKFHRWKVTSWKVTKKIRLDKDQ